MKGVLYYLSLPFLYFISLLPFWALNRISDFLFVLVYYLFGYRKEVVFQNLQNSFPEKTPRELKSIEKKFYQYFCDLILETLKSLTISPASLRKRLVFKDTTTFKKYFDQNQSIIIVMGHFGNWELGGARFAVEPLHKLNVIYHPLKNKYFNRLVYHMRTRLGNGLYAMKDTLKGMVRDRKEVTATAFIADQTPSPDGAYWTKFLHQDTPVFTGTGRIANKFNYPVLYAKVDRVSRNQYDIYIEELVKSPKDHSPEEILEAFTYKLEKDIQERPETWLWSHKRWKYKKPNSSELNSPIPS